MRPETKAKYPPHWKLITKWVIYSRGSRCEECGVRNGENGKILTVHHIDYNPANNGLDNLMVLCQGCHLRLQARELANASRYAKVEKLIRMGQLELPGFEIPRAKSWRQALLNTAAPSVSRS